MTAELSLSAPTLYYYVVQVESKSEKKKELPNPCDTLTTSRAKKINKKSQQSANFIYSRCLFYFFSQSRVQGIETLKKEKCYG